MSDDAARSRFSLLPPSGPARGLALGLLAAAPFLAGLLGVVLGQDVNWDLRNYHWYNAYAFLNGRYDGGDFMPSQTQFFFNPLLDVPFYLLATHAAPSSFSASRRECPSIVSTAA